MGRRSRDSSRRPSADEGEAVEVKREESVDAELAHELSSTRVATIKHQDSASPSASPSLKPVRLKSSRSSSASTSSSNRPPAADPDTSTAKTEPNEANGHHSTSTSPIKPEPKEPSKPARTSRTASKLPPRVAPLFNHLPDATQEATSTFTVIDACTYQNKYLGFSEHALDCDCSEEWDPSTRRNLACGEDSDCINRACKMECANDCGCGVSCRNQRFLRRLYAKVSIIKTEKKGYGLRADVDLRPHDFIFEYIGETIPEATFRKRMLQYDEEGIKHFYFMSLSKGEFIDATKRGNLGRFCNHSCNPNCYVDKWVVGDKLRMGIFAERYIKAGEELVFNYNVDRYGANPQPCYCGEANCTGFIGGKTQTERATKLSAATIEALGIEDADSWDTVVAKRPRKKKTAEDDEEYVDSVEAKSLDVDGVTKVMAALMQCKEKWIAVKLLQRIQRCTDDQAWHRVVRFHGYQILNSQLSAWRDDENIILQILDVLDRLPRLTRNKIVDAKIDKTMESLTSHSDDRVATQASALLDAWSKLELAYRIPRKKREDASTPVKTEITPFERREYAQERKRSKSRSPSPPRGPASLNAPSGPRSLQRPGAFYQRPPLPFHRGPPPLPRGWFTAQDKGRTYYYSVNGQTTWSRPTKPAEEAPPPPPPKQPSERDVLKSIIDNIVTSHDKDPKNSTPDTPELSKAKKEEKWKSFDLEKQKKLYENTLFPHISHVMNKYKHKIPRDDLKRFAKEIAKKLVASDYKAGRVQDPTKIEERQQKKVKEFCKQFFEKAYQKHKKHEAERAAREKRKKGPGGGEGPGPSPAQSPAASPPEADTTMDHEDVKMSDNEDEDAEATPNFNTPSEPNGTGTLKRKRVQADDSAAGGREDESEPIGSPIKRLNMEIETPPPPPPPPAPPAETPPDSTPREGEHDGADMEMGGETDIYADTNFKGKSMADVLAQAQAENADEGDDSEDVVMRNGIASGGEGETGNPMKDNQPVDQTVADR
ncbi:histone-lysine N-methyltransferase SETD2 [Cladophialophora psammophila CBS 110553]|uniref:Histone-lysine N-methyltransferase, H3 lysine-36 specific n=1 Tax=Cladophialophora psammophila CBS 110553 TaxID=1182543 RepID=W9XAK5_9EURO|nr:histone-lysine N-methyltransferase SETD2 [Cladophialophora psammophila CBS 110553]EXJ74345.1 histone-lysine N-methyltransferase SETD2 [Cladophialophora psammophila CBS 110553]